MFDQKLIFCFPHSARTLEDVEAGTELTIHYMMDMEEAPEWYQQSWDQRYQPEQ